MSHRPSSAAGSPLRHRVFAALWLAGMISNIGAWMQTVGAQWLLIERHSPSWEVALVQTAASLPVLLLAIPAGVLGEFLNRRRLLIVVQAAQLAIAGALWLLATGGQLTTPLLLVLTFALGACAALQLPAQQAVVPEIVDRSEIPAAAALSSVGVNVARAVGPAIAGLVVAQWGVAAVFALNAATFAVFLVTLLGWRGYQPLPIRPERVIDATRAGIRYILHAPVIRGLYLRLTWFLIPGSALWALLPVVANAQLHLDATGYGVLLGALGAGAVGAAFLLPGSEHDGARTRSLQQEPRSSRSPPPRSRSPFPCGCCCPSSWSEGRDGSAGSPPRAAQCRPICPPGYALADSRSTSSYCSEGWPSVHCSSVRSPPGSEPARR